MIVMNKNIPTKMEKKTENILLLQKEIMDWKTKSELQIFNSIKLFEKIPRDEFSLYYVSYLTDNKFADNLLKIADNYPDNEKMILNIISILGNMIIRYKLTETPEIYNFILANSTKKGIAGYVSIYLTKLKSFEYYPNKWEYFMSMQKMVPKKVAHQNLVGIINQNIQNIPEEYKKEVLSFLQTKHNSTNNIGGKKMYLDMINKIKNCHAEIRGCSGIN